MRALLLAAGLGTRLRPLTDTIPKCLVPIGGQPLLEIWLQRLCAADVGPFLVNTHHHADKVSNFVEMSRYREQVTLEYEPELLGTAGTIIKNLEFFGEKDGMLVHADNYCLADLHSFQAAHRNRPPYCLMTMMTFRTEMPSTCGIVELDKRGVVTNFHEKVSDPPGNLANGAVYIISAELIKSLRGQLLRPKDFSTEVIGGLVGRIFNYETKEFFLDIGTPESYRRANVRADADLTQAPTFD